MLTACKKLHLVFTSIPQRTQILQQNIHRHQAAHWHFCKCNTERALSSRFSPFGGFPIVAWDTMSTILRNKRDSRWSLNERRCAHCIYIGFGLQHHIFRPHLLYYICGNIRRTICWTNYTLSASSSPPPHPQPVANGAQRSTPLCTEATIIVSNRRRGQTIEVDICKQAGK